MKLELDFGHLRENYSIMVATPMYGGQCAGLYTKSTNDFSMYSTRYGMKTRFYYLFNESLITRARNYCVDEFLRSDFTHLMFIDADIGFNAQDIYAMLHLQTQDPDNIDIIAGPYPKKSISWEKVKKAVERGFADANPFVLEQFVGDYVFNPAKNVKSFRVDEPVQVLEAGTGFMLIHRATFEKYEEAYPEYHYKPDHIRTDAFDGSREIMAYFDCIIDPETRRYLSEDYMFCQNVQKLGMKVWMCPWMELKHMGSYVFGGSMAALGVLGASPTASAESSKKFYQNKEKAAEIPQLTLGQETERSATEELQKTVDKVLGRSNNMSRQQKRAAQRAERKKSRKR